MPSSTIKETESGTEMQTHKAKGKKTVSWLVGALSPVSHKGLHRGWEKTDTRTHIQTNWQRAKRRKIRGLIQISDQPF